MVEWRNETGDCVGVSLLSGATSSDSVRVTLVRQVALAKVEGNHCLTELFRLHLRSTDSRLRLLGSKIDSRLVSNFGGALSLTSLSTVSVPLPSCLRGSDPHVQSISIAKM